ncbi:hypothetical protein A3F34_01900 [Candidatus Roizmanbacteria bacterium RIFCSPHIGHO2_12_FULL_44_10]|uniref:Uncharacterized protein n=1 Tax=Candidatus Roizmanbacteria bacterium RIFCSPHIGHO2_12_FULL_44_10 TaxID=1802054 RepID=A0A1F7I990_9BACT|nr:MAG: hypothetical protein A3F34_01900 [Candidatus Roizmanbacteria bacterium RIFCSPHIGHO2_12_FULL_44_10]
MNDNNLTIPAEVQTFLEGMLQDAGMNLADDDMKTEMVKELYLRLDAYITSVVATALPQKHLDEFIKMNEEKRSREEVEQFLQDNMPHSKEVFAKAFSDFRSLYLGNVKKARDGAN